jgi:AcrR family transcriptional regulator
VPDEPAEVLTETPDPSPAQRGRPRDPNLDEVILTAAVELLAEEGYARVTMEQIALRAGVGKATVYLRWPNKVALVAEAIEHRSGVVPELPDTGSLPEDMRRFLRGLLRGYAEAGSAVAAVSGEVASNPELRRAWRRGMTGTLWAGVRVLLERAIERGELPAMTDVELLSMLPLSLMQNWRMEHEHGPDGALVERIVAQFFSPPGRSFKASPAGRSDQGDGGAEATPRGADGPDEA